MVSPLERISCESLPFQKVRFRWFWTGFFPTRTPYTFNLNTLIFWQLRASSAANRYQKKKNSPHFVSRALHVVFECFITFVFVWLLSFFVLFWYSYLIGFSSQFSVRIKIGANMAAGWRLWWVLGWVGNTVRFNFLVIFDCFEICFDRRVVLLLTFCLIFAILK